MSTSNVARVRELGAAPAPRLKISSARMLTDDALPPERQAVPGGAD